MCAYAQLCLILCTPLDCKLPGYSVHGIIQVEYWSGLPFPPPGDLPNSGIEPQIPATPALAGRCFPTELPGKPIMDGCVAILLSSNGRDCLGLLLNH